ncbi:PRC-barrel domain containing protein [Arthrobacter echini]|uniref:PRC-barrel domain containing protein n=1 Tax=Arthrobacter echini TaxID=1529066 RepID=A0A4S5E9Z5_9MICC|nr:PRC-barrel domain-containing protein [Arthrobacter echini]THJ68535.1 PRC-barrel domain containing protein [Arthrobacter echini]
MAQGEITKLQSATVWDSDGKKLGDVNDVHLERETGVPAWITVSLGLLNSRKHYAPLANSRFERDELHLGWTKSEIADSPKTASAAELSPEEESALIDHYRLRDGAE